MRSKSSKTMKELQVQVYPTTDVPFEVSTETKSVISPPFKWIPPKSTSWHGALTFFLWVRERVCACVFEVDLKVLRCVVVLNHKRSFHFTVAQFFSEAATKTHYLLPQINCTFETNADFPNITFLMTLGTPPENPLYSQCNFVLSDSQVR